MLFAFIAEKSLLELYFTDYEKDLCNTIDQLLSDSDLIVVVCISKCLL